jgi:hypothetical protein
MQGKKTYLVGKTREPYHIAHEFRPGGNLLCTVNNK